LRAAIRNTAVDQIEAGNAECRIDLGVAGRRTLRRAEENQA
jgi:hypothetical protein